MRRSTARHLASGSLGLMAFAGIGFAVAGPSSPADRPAAMQASFKTGYGVDDLGSRPDCRLVQVDLADAANRTQAASVEQCD